MDVELGRLAQLECHQGCAAVGTGAPVQVLLRPDDVIHDDASPLRAEVVHRAFRGAEFLYTLRLPSGAEVMALVASHHNHVVGETIGIRIAIDHVIAFPGDTQRIARQP